MTPQKDNRARSKERASEYFTIAQNLTKYAAGNAQPLNAGTKERVSSRASSGKPKLLSGPKTIFTKIQTLINSRPVSEEKKKNDPSFNSLKGALMKTINLQTKTNNTSSTVSVKNATQEHFKYKPGAVVSVQNASSSVDSKQASHNNSERNIMKSTNLINRVNDVRKQLNQPKYQGVQTARDNSNEKRMSPINRIRGRLNANKITTSQSKSKSKSKDKSSVESQTRSKNETMDSGITKYTSPDKNPEYFEVKKPAVMKVLVQAYSPAHSKDSKFSFNLKKILAGTKGERQADSTIKRPKGTPMQVKTDVKLQAKTEQETKSVGYFLQKVEI